MARVGFKTTYAAGTFDGAAVNTLFGHIKTYVANAGFNVLLDTADGIDFIRAGWPAGTANDDVPHWAFSLQNYAPNAQISAHTVFGNDYLDPNVYQDQEMLLSDTYAGVPAPEITVWFCADGVAGWWWLHATQAVTYSQAGVTMIFSMAGTTVRRYPSDMHQGLCARYGLWNPFGEWYPPYAMYEDSGVDSGPWFGTWSPFGVGDYLTSQRHTGSPLPRMAVPQYPARDGDTACILGEFNEILIITDGYGQGEEVLPGWMAMTGDQYDQPYAVPAPASFTLL